MDQNQKQIVIIESSTSDMTAKIARTLRKNNYETVFISIIGGLESELLKKSYSKIISFNLSFLRTHVSSIPKAFFIGIKNLFQIFIKYLQIRKLKPHAIIVRTTPNWLYFLAKKYFKNYPVIYFPIDIRSNTFNDMQEVKARGIPKFEIYSEKFGFEKADGIIHKGSEDELNHLNTNLLGDVKIKCPTIYFLPYCSKEFMINASEKKKLSYKNKEIHTVYAGHVPDDKGWIEGLRKIINQKIYIHLYSRTNNISSEDEKKRVTKLLGKLSESKYLVLHDAVGQENLSREISKYDYGFYGYCNEFLPGYGHATGNKIASYMEAGIPIISPSYYSATSKIIKKYHLGFSFDVKEFDNLKKIIQKYRPSRFKKSILKAREYFSMEHQILRLEEFFRQVRKYRYS